MQVRKADRAKSITEFLCLINDCNNTTNNPIEAPVTDSNNCTPEETEILVQIEKLPATDKKSNANDYPISEENCFRYVCSTKKTSESEYLFTRALKILIKVVIITIALIGLSYYS